MSVAKYMEAVESVKNFVVSRAEEGDVTIDHLLEVFVENVKAQIKPAKETLQ